MVKEALAVQRDILFREKYFEGFLPISDFDYISIILKNFVYYTRGEDLEHNSSLKQIIPYVLILNPLVKKLFMYRRANNESYSEVRLRNKWSCGVGGHIERVDAENPIESAMMRELQEEVTLKNYPQPKIVGYLNDDSGDVEKVHFGVVALAETNEQEVSMGDGEIAEGKFMSIEEVEQVFANPENQVEHWTK